MNATTSHPFDVPIQSLGNLTVQISDRAPGTILGTVMAPGGIVGGGKSPKGLKSGPLYPTQLITASFGFDKSGHLANYAAEGPAVGKQEDYDRVKQLVGFHPEWTDAQDIAALLKAGASYGPGEKHKLLNVIPKD